MNGNFSWNFFPIFTNFGDSSQFLFPFFPPDFRILFLFFHRLENFSRIFFPRFEDFSPLLFPDLGFISIFTQIWGFFRVFIHSFYLEHKERGRGSFLEKLQEFWHHHLCPRTREIHGKPWKILGNPGKISENPRKILGKSQFFHPKSILEYLKLPIPDYFNPIIWIFGIHSQKIPESKTPNPERKFCSKLGFLGYFPKIF